MQVAVRELKTHLSKFLALVQAGEEIEVRSHNKPIARIVGIPSAADNDLPEGIRRLIAEGTLTPGSGRKPTLREPLVLSPGGTPVSQMVIEDRG